MANPITKDDDSSKESFCIPNSVGAWERLVKQSNLQRQTVHDITQMGSGPRSKKKQFAMFRALWFSRRAYFHLEHQLARCGLANFQAQAAYVFQMSREYGLFNSIIQDDLDMNKLKKEDS